MNPYCHPNQPTTIPISQNDSDLPRYGVALKILYHVPLSFSGNQRERLITPGGEPMDCIQPLIPQRTANVKNITAGEIRIQSVAKPRTPIIRLTSAEMNRPMAMNLRILQ